MKDISVEAVIRDDGYRWIDVRSPDEYHTATVPGAVNVPLLDNEERARVGTLYKQRGPKEAVRLAMEIVSPKIPKLTENLLSAAEGKTPLLFCWRGGMRSRAMATFLDLLGEPAARLSGGYRAYREYVVRRLATYPLKSRMIVLHGLTGVGKTAILRRLEAEGVPVLDLEGMAGHRGSAFGSLGEIQPRNQRMFDALLFHRLERYRNEPFLFMEAESRRIGRVLMPPFLEKAKENGIPVLVEASEETRIRRILETYRCKDSDPDRFRRQVQGALSRIERRLPPDTRKELHRLAEAGEYASLVRILLREYYDPRYLHSQRRYEPVAAFTVQSDDLEEATRTCKAIWHRLKEEKPAPARS